MLMIGGVAADPPEAGRVWDAPDLADGLKLMKLIEGRPFFREITLIDVRNFDGREARGEPHLLMVAQLGKGGQTIVRFGRFPVEGIPDYCISPAQKLLYLDTYVRGNGGRLSGTNHTIDLRYDTAYVSLN